MPLAVRTIPILLVLLLGAGGWIASGTLNPWAVLSGSILLVVFAINLLWVFYENLRRPAWRQALRAEVGAMQFKRKPQPGAQSCWWTEYETTLSEEEFREMMSELKHRRWSPFRNITESGKGKSDGFLQFGFVSGFRKKGIGLFLVPFLFILMTGFLLEENRAIRFSMSVEEGRRENAVTLEKGSVPEWRAFESFGERSGDYFRTTPFSLGLVRIESGSYWVNLFTDSGTESFSLRRGYPHQINGMTLFVVGHELTEEKSVTLLVSDTGQGMTQRFARLVENQVYGLGKESFRFLNSGTDQDGNIFAEIEYFSDVTKQGEGVEGRKFRVYRDGAPESEERLYPKYVFNLEKEELRKRGVFRGVLSGGQYWILPSLVFFCLIVWFWFLSSHWSGRILFRDGRVILLGWSADCIGIRTCFESAVRKLGRTLERWDEVDGLFTGEVWHGSIN